MKQLPLCFCVLAISLHAPQVFAEASLDADLADARTFPAKKASKKVSAPQRQVLLGWSGQRAITRTLVCQSAQQEEPARCSLQLCAHGANDSTTCEALIGTEAKGSDPGALATAALKRFGALTSGTKLASAKLKKQKLKALVTVPGFASAPIDVTGVVLDPGDAVRAATLQNASVSPDGRCAFVGGLRTTWIHYVDLADTTDFATVVCKEATARR